MLNVEWLNKARVMRVHVTSILQNCICLSVSKFSLYLIKNDKWAMNHDFTKNLEFGKKDLKRRCWVHFIITVIYIHGWTDKWLSVTIFWSFHTYNSNNENRDFYILYSIYIQPNFWAQMVSSNELNASSSSSSNSRYALK